MILQNILQEDVPSILADEESVLAFIEKVLNFYRANGLPGYVDAAGRADTAHKAAFVRLGNAVIHKFV